MLTLSLVQSEGGDLAGSHLSSGGLDNLGESVGSGLSREGQEAKNGGEGELHVDIVKRRLTVWICRC